MISRDELVGLDFETYSAVDLFKHGLHRYAKDKTFTPLIGCGVQRNMNAGIDVTQMSFVEGGFDYHRDRLFELVKDRYVAAHNAGFEEEVLRQLKIKLPASRFIDSAMIARAAGAGGKLEAAAAQLLHTEKMVAGKNLIQLFSIPSKQQREDGDLEFDLNLPVRFPTGWSTFMDYCELDAMLSLRIVEEHGFANGLIDQAELENSAITMEMNQTGWTVDVPAVQEMQRRYLENKGRALATFREENDAPDLNLNSLPQLKKWCADRGIRASSFDEKHVASLIKRLNKRLEADDNGTQLLESRKYDDYCAVLDLMETKQILGGSSLKKLQVILDTVGDDGKLRDQYLHIGAGQSWRTTGRSVQMQNLKRLKEPANMDELQELDIQWSNEKLAENLRQVFTSSHPDGFLIVGDFSSVESRGLAWLAGAEWKLRAYRAGKDMYKVLAAEIYATPYDDITKVQRTTGKVGELSCGYGAGGGAVESFAQGMGVDMTEGEANQLVSNWRVVNPEIVQLWEILDNALASVMEGSMVRGSVLSNGYILEIRQGDTPFSLKEQHPAARTLEMVLRDKKHNVFVRRFFHGCYMRGRNVCYYKPSQLKGGPLWSDKFTDPKTKQQKYYSIYGGKLTGILTQSFCREMFFDSLRAVNTWCKGKPNVSVIGQFHDEIVLDWVPGDRELWATKSALNTMMSTTRHSGFPLAADIKHDYRYTK